MRIHSLAVATFVATASVFEKANCFVIPGNLNSNIRPSVSSTTAGHERKRIKDVNNKRHRHPLAAPSPSSTSSSSLSMAAEDSIPSSSDVANANANANVVPKKKLTRTQQRIQQLQADIQTAETSREQVLQQIVEAEQRREQLEQEAMKVLQEAQQRKQQLEKLTSSSANASRMTGGFSSLTLPSGAAVALAATTTAIGGLAAARTVLQQRNAKVAEQKRLEEERLAKEEAALKAKEQQGAAGKFLLPLLGAGTLLGALAAPFLGNRDATTTTTTDTGPKRDVKPPRKQPAAKSAASSAVDNVELPYLNKQIAKAEQTLNKAERKVRAKQAGVFKEQQALQNLEEKLAASSLDAAQMAQDPAVKRAEEKLAEETAALQKAEAEQRAAQEAEQKVAAERAAAEQRAAQERAEAERIAAEAKAKAVAEKAEADRIAAEKRAAQEQADRLNAEQKAAEEAAAKAAMEAAKKEKFAELEMLKKEAEKQAEKGTPKVPFVSQLISGKQKPTQVKDKGLANLFSIDLNKVVVGGVALAGLAVASAVIAATEEPSVSSTFKVTGKSRDEYLNASGAAPKKSRTRSLSSGLPSDEDESSESKGTVRIPMVEKKASESLPSQLGKDVPPYASSELTSSNAAAATKKSFSPFGAKPVAAQSDSMSSFPASFQSSQQSTTSGGGPKKSYSPFGRKPMAAMNDSLYSAPFSAAPATRVAETGAMPPNAEEIPVDTSMPGSGYSAPNKKSFSPFGRKPVAAIGNSLYSPSNAASIENNLPLEPLPSTPIPELREIQTVDASIRSGVNGGGTQMQTSTGAPKKSYSPFGSKPVASKNDSLYDAPRFAEWDDEPVPTTENASSFVPPMPFAATSLEEVAMADNARAPPSVESYQEEQSVAPFSVPPAFSDRGSGGVKKSYSPFGSKPQASGDGRGSGYLDGL